MKLLALGVAGWLAWCAPAQAHRLDEYLQATQVEVDGPQLTISLRLIAGVLSSDAIVAEIDSNGDGSFSPAEQRAYAMRVLAAQSLRVDEVPLSLQLHEWRFPDPAQMRAGLGEIAITLSATMPASVAGATRMIGLVNRHHPDRSVYLVNAMAPQDRMTSIVEQRRDARQSQFVLVLRQDAAPAPSPATFDSAAALALFRLGMRHIAGGADHLLFLLALLLPAPLLAVGSRWGADAPVGRTLANIVRTVSAFTVGHSMTLLLTATDRLLLPASLVEPLVALSILVAALHAVRPLFAGREYVAAGAFGLIHGMAFASTLHLLDQDLWQTTAGLLSFNLGIEAMQMLVLAAVLPSLLLLRGTRAAGWLRLGGAACAGLAACAWLLERTFGLHTAVDDIADGVTRHGPAAAAALFAVALLARLLASVRHEQRRCMESA